MHHTCTPFQKGPDAALVEKSSVFLSAFKYSQDGAEHAATVTTAFYSGADPGCHGNSKSRRILG